MAAADTRAAAALKRAWGRLPRPADLIELMRARETGQRYDDGVLKDRVRSAVVEVVHQQADFHVGHVNVEFVRQTFLDFRKLLPARDPISHRAPLRVIQIHNRFYSEGLASWIQLKSFTFGTWSPSLPPEQLK